MVEEEDEEEEEEDEAGEWTARWVWCKGTPKA